MSKSITTTSNYLDAAPTEPRARAGQWTGIRHAGSRIVAAIQLHVHEIVRRRYLRRLEYDLERIDDRTLKDIGLDRSEIHRVVLYGRGY